ncbi:hypothetical protein [Nereida sp. MMG025]|nr:hypothetical protein [Nereida sp. MMG025]MCF6443192.1 hypothetical protein [Nereida sp. MMG025]
MPSSTPPATDPKTDRQTSSPKPISARGTAPAPKTPTDYQFTDFASI